MYCVCGCVIRILPHPYRRSSSSTFTLSTIFLYFASILAQCCSLFSLTSDSIEIARFFLVQQLLLLHKDFSRFLHINPWTRIFFFITFFSIRNLGRRTDAAMGFFFFFFFFFYFFLLLEEKHTRAHFHLIGWVLSAPALATRWVAIGGGNEIAVNVDPFMLRIR